MTNRPSAGGIAERMKFLLASLILAMPISARAGSRQENLTRFADWRFGVMMHFNMGTFSNKEWSDGNEDPALFNPAKLDCSQWAKTCKSAGMKFGILTAKHHDGFCLWDSKTTTHDVASSPLKRDVVKEYMDAFRKEGLVPCLYYSIWDRNAKVGEGDYSPEKLQFVLDQLTELLTNYGPVPVLIIDGWCWKGGHRNLPYATIREHVRKLQPNCFISDHTHVQSPWDLDIIYFEGPMGEFPPETNRYPSMLGLTAQSGWFWHPGSEKKLTMNAPQIVEKLRLCEQRYCNYMVNIGPNRDGLFDDNVVAMFKEIGRSWEPDIKRPPLPAQDAVQLHPLFPASVEAPGRSPQHLIDGMSGGAKFNTIWTASKIPATVTLDLGETQTVGNLGLLPQQFPSGAPGGPATMNPEQEGYVAAPANLGDIRSGRPAKFRILAGVDATTMAPIKEGEFADSTDLKVVEFPPVKARFVRLEILSSRGGDSAVIDEIAAGSPN